MTLRQKHLVVITRAAILVALLALLEIAPRAGWFDALTLVPFSEMVAQAWEFFASGEIFKHLASTGGAVAIAFVLATVTGIPTGFALARSECLSTALNPYLTSYYAVPIFVFYPLFIALFGLNVVPLILIAWAWAVVAVVINTATGFRSVRPVFGKVARIYQLSGWDRFWKVEFPAASKHIFNGLKLAVTYSVIGVVASEFVLATQGLGWLISYHYNNFGLRQMYASILVVILMALAINALVARAERFVRGRV